MSYISRIVSIVGLMFIVSGCSLLGEKKSESFESSYSAYVTTHIANIREIGESLGLAGSYRESGELKMLVDIPAILSGALSTSYEGKVSGQDADIAFRNPALRYETLLGSGSLSAKEIAIISLAGDAFFRYEDLKNDGLVDIAADAIFRKYNSTWLALTQSDIESSLSGASEDEVLSYQISRMINTLTLADIEGYLVKYPFLKEKKDLGTANGIHTYEVELARENLIALMEEFSRKATGKDMTSEAKQEFIDSLASLNITGVIGFGVDEKETFTFSGNIASGTGEAFPIAISDSEKATLISLGSDASKITLSSTDTADGSVFLLSVSNMGKEIARLDGTMKKDDKKTFFNMTFSAPDQGLTVTLTHTYSDDKSFEGSLNAGVGNMTWKGKMSNDGLAALKLTGAMMGSNLEMDLTPGSEGILRGPLTLKSGDTVVASAQVGLLATREHFLLSLDISNPEDPTMKSRVLIDLTGKREPWSGKIEAPKDTKKFQDFADEFSALMPKDDIFNEQESLDDTYNLDEKDMLDEDIAPNSDPAL